MIGSDPADWQAHIRNKPRRQALANRFRDPTHRFKLVLVRDMWVAFFSSGAAQEKATQTVLEQTALLSAEWAAA